jgi:hypothetical protein
VLASPRIVPMTAFVNVLQFGLHEPIDRVYYLFLGVLMMGK